MVCVLQSDSLYLITGNLLQAADEETREEVARKGGEA
jgi:hypothetical protein